MQCDWSKASSVTTQELDFSQPCGFYRFSKVVHHLKQKNHIDGQNLFSKSVLSIYFSALSACVTKPKENYMSNCNFHEKLTACKKGTSNSFCDIKT